MHDPIVRNRTVYGEVCRDICQALYGLGIAPGRIEMVRRPGSSGNRVRFDVVVDGTVNYFEDKTVEDLWNAIDGLTVAKKLFQHTNLDKDKLFEQPADGRIHDCIHLSFGDKSLAEAVMPVPASNSNVREVQAAASRSVPATREKSPARVAAGRRSAAKRWNLVAGVTAPQTTASQVAPPAAAPVAAERKRL